MFGTLDRHFKDMGCYHHSIVTSNGVCVCFGDELRVPLPVRRKETLVAVNFLGVRTTRNQIRRASIIFVDMEERNPVGKTMLASLCNLDAVKHTAADDERLPKLQEVFVQYITSKVPRNAAPANWHPCPFLKNVIVCDSAETPKVGKCHRIHIGPARDDDYSNYDSTLFADLSIEDLKTLSVDALFEDYAERVGLGAKSGRKSVDWIFVLEGDSAGAAAYTAMLLAVAGRYAGVGVEDVSETFVELTALTNYS